MMRRYRNEEEDDYRARRDAYNIPIYVRVCSNLWDTLVHDDSVSDPDAVDALCRSIGTLHMAAWAIIKHPEVGTPHVQTAKLLRAVKAIRHGLRALEPLKLRPGLGSIVEADLPRLQAECAARAGGRLH